MSVNGGPNIIENGLVFSLDAADKTSYPGTGTAWNDLVGSNNGTLTNGPTFSTDGKGSIVFDGTNDYVSKTSYFNNLGFGNTFILSYGTFFSGNIYLTQLYNRALSAQEILQNYNNTKSRFGL